MLTLNRRNLLWLIPALLILTFPVWRIPVSSFLQPRGSQEYNSLTGNQDHQDFVMQKVMITQNQEERKTAEIRAKQALTSEKPDEFILTLVDADLFDEQGELINVRANAGIYNKKTRHLVLSDNVVVNRVFQNQQLYSELLHYYDDERIIDSPGKTKMVSNQSSITGGSLHYDIVTAQYTIGGRVYCVLGSE